MFPCFQFCEKREFRPNTSDSNPWKLEWNIYALPTELAVLEQKHVTLFAVSNLNCVASFFDSYAFAALRDSFWVALVISDFSCFPASYFSKTGIFRPQGNWAPERWIKSRTLYWIGYLDSMKALSFCFLLSFWTFSQIFSSVLLFPYRSS